MQITFSSILMAVFWSGILAGMIYILRKRCRYIRSFGIGCMVLVYLFCAVRILLPIDFRFTKGIPVQGVFSDIYNRICYTTYAIGNYSITIAEVFLIIWLFVAFWLFLQFVYQYWCTCRIVNGLIIREDKQCRRVLQKVFQKKGKERHVSILKSREVTVPMGIGVIKRIILLPDREYTDEALYYILLHEYTHFLNGDLVIKILVHIFCCAFWWNPIAYFLRKDLDRSLEIKCDLCITESLSAKETADYLQTIVLTLKGINQKKQFASFDDSVAIGSGKKNEMVERFEYVQKNRMSKRRGRKDVIVWLVMVCIIWMASYSFIILPSYDPSLEEIEEGSDAHELTPENAYILYKNGKYYSVDEQGIFYEISEESAEMLQEDGFEIRRE